MKAANWPNNINKILTSNAIVCNEQFKFYTAKEVENNARLIIAQHGGNYGMSLFLDDEDYERSLSDYFMSWGWKYKDSKDIIPFGSLNLISCRKRIIVVSVY